MRSLGSFLGGLGGPKWWPKQKQEAQDAQDGGSAEVGGMTIINLGEHREARANKIENRLVRLDAIKAVLTNNYLVKGWLDRNALSMLRRLSGMRKCISR